MRTAILAGLAGLAALAACSSDGGPGATGEVTVGFSTTASAGAAVAGPFFAESYDDSSGNTLTIDSVAVVVRKLHLRSAACVDVDDDDENEGTGAIPLMMDDDSAEAHDDHEDEGCPVLRLGPFLVDLSVAGGKFHDFTVTVDTGTYTGVGFQIHKPRGSRDRDFLAEHPAFDGVSIRAVGTFNGTPFVYTTAVTDVQRMRFDPPLVVGEGPTTLQVKVDLSGWFRGRDGALIDPATAVGDGVNVGVVRYNVIRSFRCHSGDDDDHEHGED